MCISLIRRAGSAALPFSDDVALPGFERFLESLVVIYEMKQAKPCQTHFSGHKGMIAHSGGA